jgi:hypothetical protein
MADRATISARVSRVAFSLCRPAVPPDRRRPPGQSEQGDETRFWLVYLVATLVLVAVLSCVSSTATTPEQGGSGLPLETGFRPAIQWPVTFLFLVCRLFLFLLCFSLEG